ncbi:MAG: Bax inhibitor-1 family protein [Lentisphaeraceae bacterium]|nr:Bax inhibitor-1 family protein [Lentisphaeraceae bacterium]
MAHPVFGNATEARSNDRSSFITKTYAHLLVAVLAFVGIESVLLNSVEGREFGASIAGNWWLVFGGYMVVSWMATRFAHSCESKFMQYLGLSLYVVAISVITLPMLMMAQQLAYNQGLDPSQLIFRAGMISLSGFFALTAIAFVTRKNFSFLRGFLMWGGVIALVLIGCSFFFGLNLGIWFSVAMVGIAGAAILYDTSNVIHEYSDGQHVGAALQLFASLAMLFWYVLRIVMALSSSD